MPNLGNDSNVHYVKFIRGITAAWNNLLENNPNKISDDTLYFIYDDPSTSYEGKLYLGRKLISGGSDNISGNININDIGDIYIDDETLSDKQILIYNDTSQHWENSSLSNIISTAVSVMIGATTSSAGASGLVPQPQVGDEDKFLKGNGTWSFIPVPSVDAVSITFTNSRLTLVGFSEASNGSIPIKTNAGIQWSNSIVGTLNRQITTLEKLQAQIAGTDPEPINENTIYMVLNGNNSESSNRYDEYIVIGNSLELLGTFGEVNLANYVTTTTFNTAVKNLNDILNDTTDTATGLTIPGLVSRVSTVENNILLMSNKIGNLNDLILSNNNETLVEEVNTINERLKWQNLNESE